MNPRIRKQKEFEEIQQRNAPRPRNRNMNAGIGILGIWRNSATERQEKRGRPIQTTRNSKKEIESDSRPNQKGTSGEWLPWSRLKKSTKTLKESTNIEGSKGSITNGKKRSLVRTIGTSRASSDDSRKEIRGMVTERNFKTYERSLNKGKGTLTRNQIETRWTCQRKKLQYEAKVPYEEELAETVEYAEEYAEELAFIEGKVVSDIASGTELNRTESTDLGVTTNTGWIESLDKLNQKETCQAKEEY